MRLSAFVALVVFCGSVLGLTGSSDCHYAVDHQRLVAAAIEAIVAEAQVKREEIVRCDTEKKGGMVTDLKACYVNYSKIKIRVDSTGGNSCAPELEVKITTGKLFFTRHKEWEQRVHEVVALKLTARQHGEESKPTALPSVPPPKPTPARTEVLPPEGPLPPAPAPVPDR